MLDWVPGRRGGPSHIWPLTYLAPYIFGPLHIWIVRPAAAFGDHPVDVLGRVLDVAGLAVHAVLRVYLQARVPARRIAHDLVDPRRAVALFRRLVLRQVDPDRHRRI